MSLRTVCISVLAVASVWTATGQQASTGLMDVMVSELDRNFRVLKEKADPAPYFMSFTVTEDESAVVSATMGALARQSRSRSRTLDVSVRVGSRQLDNYRSARGERVHFTQGSVFPLDDNPVALRHRLWQDSDRVYRLAAERLIKIKTSTEVKVAAEDRSGDFSEEEAVQHAEPARRLDFGAEAWTDRVRKLSGAFARYPQILTSGITVLAQQETKYFANSEGTRIVQGRGFARVILTASGRAEDGMDLGTSDSFEAASPDGLPDDKTIHRAIDKVSKDLTGLLKAPVAEPFVGPAILSGKASGVFFHEIFGHRIEGHRQKDEAEGQTFTKSLGGPVLPEFLSVLFDPTMKKLGGIDLNGWYEYDDEGVPARPVRLVENGILKAFLMSRSPVKGFPKSNGHGRKQPGLEVASRQSNLIVESSRKVPERELRQMLIAEVKRQNKPYGLYFEHVVGGFTTTQRAGLQAFKVIPVVVYRVFPDGRPDELIRGVDIVGTPLASFAKIVATSDQPGVFNGYCGAESGSVPVAAISPAILVSEIEVEKKAKSQDRPPLLPSPGETAEAGR